MQKGVGQVTGPGIAGVLADYTSSFGWNFAMAAAVTTLGVVLSSSLRHPDKGE